MRPDQVKLVNSLIQLVEFAQKEGVFTLKQSSLAYNSIFELAQTDREYPTDDSIQLTAAKSNKKTDDSRSELTPELSVEAGNGGQ